MLNQKMKPIAAAVGSAFVVSLATTRIAQADEDLFVTNDLPLGYNLLAGKDAEGKCGEGKCGEATDNDAKEGEGKCGEGKCGEDSDADGAHSDASDSAENKDGEGKCGEGKCGEAKRLASELPYYALFGEVALRDADCLSHLSAFP